MSGKITHEFIRKLNEEDWDWVLQDLGREKWPKRPSGWRVSRRDKARAKREVTT